MIWAAALLLAAVTYTYDDAGRLAKVDYGDGRTITYTYDAAGNVIRREVNTAQPASQKKKPAKRQKDAKGVR